MTEVRLIGAALLVIAGWGSGRALSERHVRRWRELRTFTRLLTYLHTEIRYRTLPGEELLAAAGQYEEFRSLNLERCRCMADLPVPAFLEAALAVEVRAGLQRLAFAPLESACLELEHLQSLCGSEERAAREKADDAKRLFPRAGAYLGLMACVLLL